MRRLAKAIYVAVVRAAPPTDLNSRPTARMAAKRARVAARAGRNKAGPSDQAEEGDGSSDLSGAGPGPFIERCRPDPRGQRPGQQGNPGGAVGPRRPAIPPLPRGL